MKSYDYAHRRGFREITWEQFDSLSNRLVEALARYNIDMVLGIARAGLFPATAVACKMRTELYPLRVTRREGDRVVRDRPIWKVGLTDEVAGKTIAIVDEMADSGETLRMVADEATRKGASKVVSASLVAHTWVEPFPDVVALTSDALVIFPWDKRVYIWNREAQTSVEGQWRLHPELSEAVDMRNALA